MSTFTHDTWISPFTWRYGSEPMRRCWSEVGKRRLWRRIWVALAQAQSEAGLVRPEQVDDLLAHVDEVDIDEAHRLEAELQHDLMAEVHTYAAQCPVGEHNVQGLGREQQREPGRIVEHAGQQTAGNVGKDHQALDLAHGNRPEPVIR
jgi:hypothetical protein